jgi:hypothetical protein
MHSGELSAVSYQLSAVSLLASWPRDKVRKHSWLVRSILAALSYQLSASWPLGLETRSGSTRGLSVRFWPPNREYSLRLITYKNLGFVDSELRVGERGEESRTERRELRAESR